MLFAFCRQDKHLNPLDLPVTVSSTAVWKGARCLPGGEVKARRKSPDLIRLFRELQDTGKGCVLKISFVRTLREAPRIRVTARIRGLPALGNRPSLCFVTCLHVGLWFSWRRSDSEISCDVHLDDARCIAFLLAAAVKGAVCPSGCLLDRRDGEVLDSSQREFRCLLLG